MTAFGGGNRKAAGGGDRVVAGARSYSTPATWRTRGISLVILLVWGVLAARLVTIQGSQTASLSERVVRQSVHREVLPARPGEILDRDGRVLAMSIVQDSLFVVPRRIESPREFAWQLAAAVDVDADRLYARLTEHADRQFLWVRRRLSEDNRAAVRECGLPADTWGIRREFLRRYPQGPYAAHVLGLRDIDNIGRGGLEESLHSRIRGTDGYRVVTRDARGKVIEIAEEHSSDPRHGESVLTTLDIRIQIVVEHVLDDIVYQWAPEGACAVVMNPHTGEILAMASRPSFDPNDPGGIPSDAWKNLVTGAVYEPGSTVKPLILGYAVDHHYVEPGERIDCGSGVYRMGRRLLHDHHAFGPLTPEEIVVRSSNIGMARIGERLGVAKLYEAVREFGFGRRTGIELRGEVAGLLHPVKAWNSYSLGSVPMGHEFAVTPLQLIAAHAVPANGGRLLRPRLLLEDDAVPAPLARVETVRASPRVESRILLPETCRWLTDQVMRNVVAEGTGKAARIPGASVFGKTGTAQKTDPETGRYQSDRSVCSFIGGIPAEAPTVLCLIVVDEPTRGGGHFGGNVAAPGVAAILREVGRLRPALLERGISSEVETGQAAFDKPTQQAL